MRMHLFLTHFKRLALGLGLLALGSALLAPALVLAKEGRKGLWTTVCVSGLQTPDTQDGSAADPVQHCTLCMGGGLTLPPTPAAVQFGKVQGADERGWQGLDLVLAVSGDIPIRGPPGSV